MGDREASEQLEYEQMRLFNIFSDEEILKIHKARKVFETRISSTDKEIKDFIEYIKYERKLISASKERIQQMHIMEENTMAPLIAQHIKQIYSEALKAFPQSARFWDEYIKFLQQFKFYDDISEAFESMLKIHDDKPEVWSRAIQWEHHENFQTDRVQDLMKSARAKHPKSLTLHLTLFQVELEKKRKRDVNKAIEHAEEWYAKGKLRFPQIEFYIETLKIVDKLSYARPIQRTILNDMRREFSKNEILWHTLAQRELHGLTINEHQTSFIDEIKQEDEDSKSSFSKSQSSDHSELFRPMRKRIESCLKTYKEGIEHIDSPKMWEYFLNCMLELGKDLSTQSSMKKYALLEAFGVAHEKSVHMTEEHYTKYLEILYTEKRPDETINNVLQGARTVHRTSLSLWLQQLRYYIQKRDFPRAKETFYQSRNYLGENSIDMWRWYLIYIKSHRTMTGEFEKFITELANERSDVYILVKSHVLELLENTKGSSKALETCELFLQSCPDSLELQTWKTELEERKNMTIGMNSSRNARNGPSSMANGVGRTRGAVAVVRPQQLTNNDTNI